MTEFDEKPAYVIIAKKLGKEPEKIEIASKLEERLMDVGADSLDTTEIMMGLEEAYHVSFDEKKFVERFGRNATIANIITYVRELTASPVGVK